MRQRILVISTTSRNLVFAGRFESQYLVGAASPGGHSINSVSSGRPAAPSSRAPLLGAVRTRTRAKRDVSFSAEPSRQVIVRQACFGKRSASVFTLTRCCGSATAHTLTGGTQAPR